MVGEVVEVHAQHDGGPLGFGQRDEHLHQLTLAVVATIEVIAHVGGIVELVGVGGDPPQTPLGCESSAVLVVLCAERCGDCGRAEYPLRAEQPSRHCCDQRRVGTAREGHDDPTEAAEGSFQASESVPSRPCLIAAGHGFSVRRCHRGRLRLLPPPPCRTGRTPHSASRPRRSAFRRRCP